MPSRSVLVTSNHNCESTSCLSVFIQGEGSEPTLSNSSYQDTVSTSKGHSTGITKPSATKNDDISHEVYIAKCVLSFSKD